jgi:secretion/DNA translocation related TadE-like protein
MVVIMSAAFVSMAVAQQAMARQQVGAAADIAALGAAGSRAHESDADPCAEAARLAQANGAELIACAVEGDDVMVRVSRSAPPLVRRLFALAGSPASDVTAGSRAGPPGDG